MYFNFVAICSTILYLCITAQADVDCSRHPEHVNPRECCPMPELFTDDLKEKCQQYDQPLAADHVQRQQPPHHHHPPPPPPHQHYHQRHHPHHHHNPCFLTCIWNETGIYTNEMIDEDKLIVYLQNLVEDTEEATDMQTVLFESFISCAEDIQQLENAEDARPVLPLPPADSENPMICAHNAVRLTRCIFKTMFNNCPNSVWNDSEQCNELREHFNNCKPIHEPSAL